MPDVKIVKIVDGMYDTYEEQSFQSIRDTLSDWETISDDDYTLLKNYLYHIQKNYKDRLCIIVKDDVPVNERIKSIKTLIDQERKKQEEELAKKRAIEQERARKRMLKKAGDELKLLNELKKKYPDQ